MDSSDDADKIMVFVRNNQPANIDDILQGYDSANYKLVYGCETTQDCEKVAEVTWSNIYVIHDNTWIDGQLYLQVRTKTNSIWKGAAFISPVKFLWSDIDAIESGIKSVSEYVDNYQQKVSEGKYPAL
jgi:hypothetical protein